MKKLFTIFALSFTSITVEAQQVAKTVVVEHFTNSYCSACASRNPGFYSTLTTFPNVLHIAYHPSSPYPMCTINQHNKAENDDRPNFYNIFGGTPRIVIQGNVIPSSTNYGDAQLYQNEQGKMSSFSVKATIKAANNTADVTVTIKKEDTSSLTTLTMYAAIAEDTFFFNAPNGEKHHHDVFRKSVWGAPQAVSNLNNVGDSVVMTQNINIHTDWVAGRTSVTALLQDGNKQIVQAARSGTLDFPVSIAMTSKGNDITIFPNPVNDVLMLKGLNSYPAKISITSTDGRIVSRQYIENKNSSIQTSTLQSGMYFLAVDGVSERTYYKFFKN